MSSKKLFYYRVIFWHRGKYVYEPGRLMIDYPERFVPYSFLEEWIVEKLGLNKPIVTDVSVISKGEFLANTPPPEEEKKIAAPTQAQINKVDKTRVN
jgi:hypothetical protein